MSLWRRIYTERRAVVLPVFVIVIVNLAVLLLAELPLSHSVTGLKSEAVAASLKMSQARVTEQRAKEARASKERADQDLRKFYAETLPADLTSARRLIVGSFLQRTARDVGLTFQRGSVEQMDVKDSQLQGLTGKVTLVGDYQNVRRFLYTVETAREFLVVERVALSQATNMKAGNTGALEVTLDVATYYLGAR